MEDEDKNEELYSLYKLQTVQNVKNDVVDWAKSRLGILAVLLAILGFFGAGGYISLIVGDRINLEMVEVDKRVLDTVKLTVQAEMAATQASVDAKKATKEAVSETNKVIAAAKKLSETIARMEGQAALLELRLEKLRKQLGAQSENVRDEAHLLVESTKKRLNKVEAVIEKLSEESSRISSKQVSQEIVALKKGAESAENQFSENSKYEIYLAFASESNTLANYFEKLFRNKGFRVSTWPNLESNIKESWGVSLESLGGEISILVAPNMVEFGESIASDVRKGGAVTTVRILIDRLPWGDPKYAGVLIPPGYPVPTGIQLPSNQ